MADISEVTANLAALAASVIYPSGIAQPSIVATPVLIYEGWPDSATLNDDLGKLNTGDASGRLHVSVFVRPGETPTTRYRATPQPLDSVPAAIALAQSGNTVTVSGSINAGDNIAVQIGANVSTYQVQAGDTLTGIIETLAGFAQGASIDGLSVTYPDSVAVQYVATGGHGRQLKELRRQRREIQLTVWAADPATRSALAAPLDETLAATRFIYFQDGTAGRLVYVSSPESDARSPVQLYRRDLIYSVEFATTQIIPTTQIVATEVNVTAQTADGIDIDT